MVMHLKSRVTPLNIELIQKVFKRFILLPQFLRTEVMSYSGLLTSKEMTENTEMACCFLLFDRAKKTQRLAMLWRMIGDATLAKQRQKGL